jgi:hypothetical protein
MTDTEPTIQESWRRTWRVGIAPLLSTDGLEALERALATDDPCLIQQNTLRPAYGDESDESDDPAVYKACAIALCGWRGDGKKHRGELLGWFAAMLKRVEEAMGEPRAAVHFLEWYDVTPRQEMRRQLLPEVRRELDRRLRKDAHAAGIT